MIGSIAPPYRRRTGEMRRNIGNMRHGQPPSLALAAGLV